MANASAYFKCYPSDFLQGVLGLEPDQIAVYTVILMLIYDRGEPIADDSRSLSWRCRMDVRRFKNVVDSLVEDGKLTRRDGLLSNLRAEKVISYRRDVAEMQSRNAKQRWTKSNEINGPNMPTLSGGNAYQIPDSSIVVSEVKETSSTTRPKRVRTRREYSVDFEAFWKSYPTDANMGKWETFEVWGKLEQTDRDLAVKAVPAFIGYCRSHPDCRPIPPSDSPKNVGLKVTPRPKVGFHS